MFAYRTRIKIPIKVDSIISSEKNVPRINVTCACITLSIMYFKYIIFLEHFFINRIV